MRARHAATALCLLLLSVSAPAGAQEARDAPPEAEERGSPHTSVYWPAMLSFGLSAASVLVGLSATLSADTQIEAADRILRSAAARTPGDRMVCPLGTQSAACLEVSSRLEDARRLDNTAIAAYAIGGMTAAVGLALSVWPLQVPGARHAAAVSPVASPHGGGLRVVGTF